MSNLTPNQRAKLEALWRSMSPQMRASLHASARASTGGEGGADLIAIFGQLEEALAEPAGDLAKAYILSPLRPLTAEPDSVPPSLYRFSPDDLSKIWGWLGRHLAKDTVETARKCKKPETDPIWHEYRRTCSDALGDAVASAERVPKDMTALVKRFGNDAGDMLKDAVVLLRSSEEICGAMSQIPMQISDFNEDLVYKLRDIYTEMVETRPEAAVWVVLLAMGRLDSPWEIFRAVEKIGRRGDDLVVANTEMGQVGDAVLADTGYFAAKLKHPPASMDEAKQSYNIFDRYVAYSSGMTKEFGIRKAGRWGQVLFSLRAEASTNVEKIFEKVPLALDSGLPEPRRGRSGRIIPAQLPNDDSVSRAEGLLYFLAQAREHANAAAVASSQKRILETAVTRMQDAGEMLVDLVASSEGQNRTVAQDGLETTARLLEAAGESDMAALFRRRGVAAAA